MNTLSATDVGTTTDGGGAARRRVLDAGSGGFPVGQRGGLFDAAGWDHVTIDIDPSVGPDHVGSLVDMRSFFPDRSFEAVWSSHTLEHLYGFELRAALGEFRRVLKPDGFALITCPDVAAVAAAVVAHGLDHTAYLSPAGPITLHDILYGHGASIAAGSTAMAHRTGLTADRLGRLSLAAGFAETVVGSGSGFDLWALLCAPEADGSVIADLLADSEAAFLFSARPGA